MVTLSNPDVVCMTPTNCLYFQIQNLYLLFTNQAGVNTNPVDDNVISQLYLTYLRTLYREDRNPNMSCDEYLRCHVDAVSEMCEASGDTYYNFLRKCYYIMQCMTEHPHLLDHTFAALKLDKLSLVAYTEFSQCHSLSYTVLNPDQDQVVTSITLPQTMTRVRQLSDNTCECIDNLVSDYNRLKNNKGVDIAYLYPGALSVSVVVSGSFSNWMNFFRDVHHLVENHDEIANILNLILLTLQEQVPFIFLKVTL